MHKRIVLAAIIIVLLGCVAASNFAGTYSGFMVSGPRSNPPGEMYIISLNISQDGSVIITSSSATSTTKTLFGTLDGSNLQMSQDEKGCFSTGSVTQTPSFNGTENKGKNIWLATCSSGSCMSNGLDFVGSYSGLFIDHNGNIGNSSLTITSNNTATGTVSTGTCESCGGGDYTGTLYGSKLRLIGTASDYGGGIFIADDLMTGTSNSAPSFTGTLVCNGGQSGGNNQRSGQVAVWFATCSSGPCLSSIVCTPNWNCTGFNNCSLAGVQTQTCTDLNNCSNSSGEPLESQACVPIPIICTPNWNCTDFGDCSANGTQVRICTDMNNCNTTSNEPIESQICVPTPVACFPDWSCTVFSNCTRNGTQTRTCTDTNNCNTTSNEPIEIQNCTSTSSNNTPIYVIGLLIIIVAAAFYWMRMRKPVSPKQVPTTQPPVTKPAPVQSTLTKPQLPSAPPASLPSVPSVPKVPQTPTPAPVPKTSPAPAPEPKVPQTPTPVPILKAPPAAPPTTPKAPPAPSPVPKAPKSIPPPLPSPTALTPAPKAPQAPKAPKSIPPPPSTAPKAPEKPLLSPTPKNILVKSLLNEKILELIKTSRALGYEYAEIKEHLIRDGYSQDEVDMVIIFEEAREKKENK